MNRPGDRLRAFAAQWCCPDTMARFIDPMIADLQQEHADALRRGQRWRSRSLRAAAAAAFVKVMILCAWTGALSLGQGWTSDDRRALISAIMFSGGIAIAIVVVSEYPLLSFSIRNRGFSARSLLYLAPRALPVAMTAGATLGIVFSLAGRSFSRRVSAGVLALALVVSAFTFVNLAWIAPTANQAFRELLWPANPVVRHPNELTLRDLGRLSDDVERDHLLAGGNRRREIALAYYTRWSLSFAPLVFSLFALSIVARSAGRRWRLGGIAMISLILFDGVIISARAFAVREALAPSVAAWYPNLVVIGVAGLVYFSRLSPARHGPAAS